MARKQLIKGANAARVEARISRVPADLGVDSGEAQSIFGALRALEAAAPLAAKPAAKPAARPRPAPRAPAAPEPVLPEPVPLAPAPPEPAAKLRAKPQAKQGRLGPSDFSGPEREAILRSCRDYRNHLPTYLLAVQKELEVLDSVIEKCRAASSD
jgi:hypothetical protein